MNKEEIIEYLFQNNGHQYNMHKASEEFQELALVLNQKILKPTKVDDQEIIDEIGDADLRLAILKKMYPMEEIERRINYKLSRYKEYIDHKLYQHI